MQFSMEQHEAGAEDTIVSISNSIYALGSIMQQHMSQNNLDFISPQVYSIVSCRIFLLTDVKVVTTLLWFLRRWSRVYLFFQEKHYGTIR